MNIPNILTILRFLLVPVFGYYMYDEKYLIAIVLFLVAGLTDVLDGYIARRFNMITAWGKLADPAADKLMQITALIMLTYKRFLPIEVIIIVLAKELFMIIGSVKLLRKDKVVVSANWYGKLATVIFYAAIIMTIIVNMERLEIAYRNILVGIFVTIAVLATLFAFVMYTFEYRRFRDGSK
ncbi:MAG TPA: CDP-diacylglycerol--glycerol-3-phosphate 3-phosphatidyltransferase [Clostridia bacterium]|nr:CDP-diacylglycerol--glycerol-3-phosphate 3-phosphatidyltransferase [Clostridia bacterium]